MFCKETWHFVCNYTLPAIGNIHSYLVTHNAVFEDDESSKIDVKTLEAISGAIERLNHLGIAIRQSSVRDQSLKARRFAEYFDLSSFENVARLALGVLYPIAPKDLREQLAQSMVDIYGQFLYRKERYRGLQARRKSQHPALLGTIDEDQQTERDTVNKSGHGDGSQRPSRPYPQRSGVSPSRPLRPGLPTEPTSIDTREFWHKINKPSSRLILGGTQTVVATQVDYPRPAKGSMSCKCTPHSRLNRTRYLLSLNCGNTQASGVSNPLVSSWYMKICGSMSKPLNLMPCVS